MSKWEQKKQKGNEEFKKKNYLAAVGLYTEAIEIDPSQDTLYNNRGLCYMNLNKFENAKNDLLKAIELNPQNIKALRRLSNVYITEGELMEAEMYLTRATKIDNNDQTIKHDLNEVQSFLEKKNNLSKFKLLNDWDKCYEITSLLITKCKNCLEIKLIAFESMINLFNIDSAFQFYKTYFTEIEKQNETIQFLLSLAYYTDGKYEKSKQILVNLLNKSNDDSLIEKTKNLSEKLEKIQTEKDTANNCYIKNDFDGAINIYTNLLSMDTNNKLFNALILSNRALCYYKKNEYFSALHDINASIKLNNKYWKSYQRRANINIKLKYVEQVKEDLRKVLELDPTNRDAYVMLNDIQREEKKAKRKDLYSVLELNKNASSDEIRRAFKRLAIKWHPDKNSFNDEQKQYAEKMFKDINEAYNTLIDERKRNIYDNGGNPDEILTSSYSSGNKKRRERSRESHF